MQNPVLKADQVTKLKKIGLKNSKHELDLVQTRIESIRSQMSNFYSNKRVALEQRNMMSEMSRAQRITDLVEKLYPKRGHVKGKLDRLLRQDKRTTAVH